MNPAPGAILLVCMCRRWLAFAALLLVSAIARAGSAPSFILIIADDMDAPAMAHMPVVQARLVAEGTQFNRAFVTTPNCCPSRASILRGQYAHNHGVLANANGFQTFYKKGREASTLATWLHGAGYRTVLLGKYLNGYGVGAYATYVPPGWDEWYALVATQEYYNYDLNVNGSVILHSEYQTDVLASYAVDFIQRQAGSDQPFFMYLAPTAPHKPFVAAPRHADAFAEMTSAPRPPSFNEEDVSDKPAWVRGWPIMSDATIAQIDTDYRTRLQMLLAVDEMIGGLIQALEEIGRLDNTYIMFLSDNGWEQGEHRLNYSNVGKGSPYEESIRVPLAIRGPGIPAQTSRDDIVLNIDIAPTFAELAGVSADSFVDGTSFAPLLTNTESAWARKRFLVEFLVRLAVPKYNALRTEEHLYVNYYETGEEELYDIVADPYQLNSLHASSDPALLDVLRGQLAPFSKCKGGACAYAEK